MQRRRFLSATLASASAATAAAILPASFVPSAAAQSMQKPADGKTREYYLVRQYHMQTGPQTKLAEHYFSDALIPALTRLGLGPIGAFRLDFGPETPTFYLIIPGSSAELLATLDLHLAMDEAFVTAAQPFWAAPATAPAFIRVDSSLLSAFEGWPKLTPSPASATKGKRTFQLRTYESPSFAAHVRKVEMFNNGEFAIFTAAGFHSIFYGDTLIGPRMPSLTYMLSATDANELNSYWDKFRDDPNWKKLSTSQRYSYEEIVSNITNLILQPLSCSQI